MELDALEQRAADNSVNRLQDLLDAIGISATAVEMGPGAVATVADHLKYSKTTVKRLAAMHDLPQDCIDLNVKPGTYWAVLLHAEEAEVEPVDFIRTRVIPEQMTPAQARRAMGIEVVRESALGKLKESIADALGLIMRLSKQPLSDADWKEYVLPWLADFAQDEKSAHLRAIESIAHRAQELVE